MEIRLLSVIFLTPTYKFLVLLFTILYETFSRIQMRYEWKNLDCRFRLQSSFMLVRYNWNSRVFEPLWFSTCTLCNLCLATNLSACLEAIADDSWRTSPRTCIDYWRWGRQRSQGKKNNVFSASRRQCEKKSHAIICSFVLGVAGRDLANVSLRRGVKASGNLLEACI